MEKDFKIAIYIERFSHLHPRNKINQAMSSAGITWCCLIDFNKVQQLKDSGPFGIILSFKLSKSKSALLISVESLICLWVSQRKARSSFSEGLLLPRSLKAIPNTEALTQWQRMGTFVPLRFPCARCCQPQQRSPGGSTSPTSLPVSSPELSLVTESYWVISFRICVSPDL